MNKTRTVTAALVFAALVVVVGAGGFGLRKAQQAGDAQAALAAPPATGVTEVALQDFAFTTPHIRVAPGTTVTWTNRDSAAHTVTFRGGADSGLIARGGTYRYTFTAPGTYDYYCTPHRGDMVGRVTVG